MTDRMLRGLFWLGVVVVVLGLFIVPFLSHMVRDTVTFQVRDKERVNSDSSSRYLIFTDAGTFENTDTLLEGKFDSSEMYGFLQEGHCYEADVYGFRIPFFSMYQNILTAVEVTCE